MCLGSCSPTVYRFCGLIVTPVLANQFVGVDVIFIGPQVMH